jgi:hypothetical protein
MRRELRLKQVPKVLQVCHATLKVALIGATIIMSAKGGMAATITVHEPDGNGRVFVDVVGQINNEDFKAFKEKTDQIYPIGSSFGPKWEVIVTLISYGGRTYSAVQIGDQVRKRGMSTFVPGDRVCSSACALIWLAGRSRTVGNTSQIGFHASYDPTTRRETGSGNAVVGAYLRDLGLGYKAIHFMTRAGPTNIEWLTPDLAKEMGVAWAMLEPPRAILIPPQPKPQPRPLQVVEWSKSAPSVAPQQLAKTTPASPTLHIVPVRPALTTPEPSRPQQDAITPRVDQTPAVAQNAVLYEEDPADPNGKRFVGSAIWRTETVTAGPGQPPEVAIRADVEVPERKVAMTWSLRRNTDKGLPATHTVDIMFKLPADFPAGGISNVPGILMKQAEQTRGVPLAGLAVKITPAFYLIGLSDAEADKERNLQLLKERSWIDILVVYNDNRRAILALEKGTAGERVFADAFKVWDHSAPVPQRAVLP